MIQIRPLGANVAVRLLEVTDAAHGPIIVPRPRSGFEVNDPESGGKLIQPASRESPLRWGEIVSVGEFVRLVTVGQTVLFNSLTGNEVNGLIVVPETAVLLSEP